MSTKLYIKLDKITFQGKHGVSHSERSKRQPFIITLIVVPKSRKSLSSDNLNDTIDYLNIYSKVKKNIEDKSFKLLESLGNSIIKDIVTSFQVRSIKLSIRKPSIQLDNNIDFIEILFKEKI